MEREGGPSAVRKRGRCARCDRRGGGSLSGLGRSGERAAQVTGPISGGRRNRIFGAHAGDLAAHGYVEEEYLLSGAAARYAVIGAQTPDGRWTLKPGERRPFATRLLVRRPRDLKRFNGTLLVEWLNVSLGFEDRKSTRLNSSH